MKLFSFISFYFLFFFLSFSQETGVIEIINPTSQDSDYYYLKYTYWVSDQNIPLRGSDGDFITDDNSNIPIYVVDDLVNDQKIVNGITFLPQPYWLRQYKGESGSYVLNFLNSNSFTQKILNVELDQLALEILLSQIYLTYSNYYYSYVNNQYRLYEQRNEDGNARERIDFGSYVYSKKVPAFLFSYDQITEENVYSKNGLFLPILLYVTESNDLKFYVDPPATNDLRFEFAAPFLSNFVSFYYYQSEDGSLLRASSALNYSLSSTLSMNQLSDKKEDKPLIQYLSLNLSSPSEILFNGKTYNPTSNLIWRKKDYQLDVSLSYWIKQPDETSFTMMSSQYVVYYNQSYQIYVSNYLRYLENDVGYVIASRNALNTASNENREIIPFYSLPPGNIATAGATKTVSNQTLPIHFEFTQDGYYYTLSEGAPPTPNNANLAGQYYNLVFEYEAAQYDTTQEFEGPDSLSY